MREATQQLLSGGPLVVGTVHSAGSLALAGTLLPGEVDVLEYRIDSLAEIIGDAERAVIASRIPVLLTVRHPDEGGSAPLDAVQRKALYRRFIPRAAFVDIELRSLPEFADVLKDARRAGCGVIVSSHDFSETPPSAEIDERQGEAFEAGADIFKIACLTSTAGDLARLLDFTERPAGGLHSVMGMGRFGRVSRLALAEAGSVLNYGYLDAPNAPGQWEARELRRLIARK